MSWIRSCDVFFKDELHRVEKQHVIPAMFDEVYKTITTGNYWLNFTIRKSILSNCILVGRLLIVKKLINRHPYLGRCKQVVIVIGGC
jgi:hypothetical protein